MRLLFHNPLNTLRIPLPSSKKQISGREGFGHNSRTIGLGRPRSGSRPRLPPSGSPAFESLSPFHTEKIRDPFRVPYFFRCGERGIPPPSSIRCVSESPHPEPGFPKKQSSLLFWNTLRIPLPSSKKQISTPSEGVDICFCGIHCTKFEPFLKAILTRKSETMRTKFCGNNFLGKGFRKTSADSFFLNSDVASGGGGVWGGILRLLLFLFWRNSGGLNLSKFLYLFFRQ